MSWRARSSSTATSRYGESRSGNQSSPQHQRSKTAITKSKSDERGQERELFIGWEGQDTYLQLETIGIETWGKRSSRPKQVANVTEHAEGKNGDSCPPWEFYLCWTYTKCSTISDYDHFVANSLSSKFKPDDEITTAEDDSSATEAASTSDNINTENKQSTAVKDEHLESSEQKYNGDTSCAIPNSQNKSEQKGITSDGKTKDKTTSKNVDNPLKTIARPVLNLIDSRQNCISHSAPTLRTLDKVESERRVSSAKSGSSSQDGSTREIVTSKEQHISSNQYRLRSVQMLQADKQGDANTNSGRPGSGNIKDTANNRDKEDTSSIAASETISYISATVTNIPEMDGVEKRIGFELPKTTHVSLGDLLTSTPRVQRRLGTARGRDPQVYAALHGKTPPRPQTPVPGGKSSPTLSNSNSAIDIQLKRTRSPLKETELPPVKDPRSPRSETGSVDGSTNFPVAANGSAIAPKEFPSEDLIPTVPVKYDGVSKGKVALLSYHKNSDVVSIGDSVLSKGSDLDLAIPVEDNDKVAEISENGDRKMNKHSSKKQRRRRKARIDPLLPLPDVEVTRRVVKHKGTSAGLHLYSGPKTLESAIVSAKCDDRNTMDISPYDIPSTRPSVIQPSQREMFVRKARIASQVLGQKIARCRTRGPPGFRPQGQKTPLHRAMESAHKKLYGQHYHLFSQQSVNYGNYGQQERRRRVAGGSAHIQSQRASSNTRIHEPSNNANNANTWPQQLETRIRPYRSTTAPTRRMYGPSGTVHGGVTHIKHTGHIATSDYHSNSLGTHSRKKSTQNYLAGERR